MKGFFYDTETTGLPLWKDPSNSPIQPHLVQLAATLVDIDDQKTMASMNVIIKPDGWEIPADVAAIHGISTAAAQEWGILEETALSAFLALWLRADVRIAHGERFDARIIRIAMKRYMGDAPEALHTDWKTAPAECTMLTAHPLLGLGKFPKLQETYQHFYGQPFEGAHTAMADVQACMAVYFAIQGVPSVKV